ncbi:hypothetical protein [Fictibacillus phosphorivorans]|uniref:hypothetical protein n=1 Tax=Fictibacillus phosphorivorans TaxID=1221500 RepID=UPI00203A7A24|nr:hypothetical protein [Fictibacillus phosphorivorans]MCM3720057.1 hypothetical protein [Fictibacillus phosphorivorans]MCM3777744.1 hypothetical protein [Fictibacillus phosphorivorans]
MESMNLGDIFFQFMAFLVLLVIISGIGMLVRRAVSSNTRLKRLEVKVDQLLDEKRRERP